MLTPTSVTIGYDSPWRQVEALLIGAAERTPGVRREPRPIVIQAALEDFYVKYVLMVCLEQQERKALTLHHLHANIQDLFNEHGVQIMSPNYESRPAGAEDRGEEGLACGAGCPVRRGFRQSSTRRAVARVRKCRPPWGSARVQ